jgi:TRAP-type mannitol/chloroaromatic compound transport system permease small subunit
MASDPSAASVAPKVQPLSTGGRIADFLDRITERIGQLLGWLILATVLLSAGNAVLRYTFALSSNAMLELQWYLFSAVFLLGGGYALRHGAHVRIDVLSNRLSQRTQAWIDLFGTVFFLLPMAFLVIYLSWPVFLRAFDSGEVSTNAGGLLLWPARLLVPAGFALLVLQALSELLKRVDEIRLPQLQAAPSMETQSGPNS